MIFARFPKPAIDAARTLKSHAMSPVILAGLVRLFEWLVIAGTGLALYAWYLGSQFGFSALYVGMIVGVPTVAVAVFQLLGLYTPYGMRSIAHQGLRIVGGWTVLFALMLAFAFFSNVGDDLSRLWVGLWFALV
jgi:hypothetical protein